MIASHYKCLQQAHKQICNSEQICVFGIGTLFGECYDQIVGLIGRKPDYLCDNDPQKWGQFFFGIPCLKPDSLVRKKTNLSIIISIRNHEKLEKQLIALGFTNIYYIRYERNYNIAQTILNTTTNKPETKEYINSINLENSWSLVTGASRGIGFFTARELGRLGSNLIVHARTLEGLKKIEDELACLPIKIKSIAADFAVSKELSIFLKQVIKQFPPIDIVYNNAGISPPRPSDFWKIPEEDYLKAYQVNTIAPIRICTTIIPEMKKRKFGRVINLSSSILKRPAEMAYACSKAALDKFIFDLAPSLEGTGVSIATVDPGWIQTDMGGINAPLPPETVLPGILIPALLENDINGQWISAQDYAELTLNTALQKAAQQISIITSKL